MKKQKAAVAATPAPETKKAEKRGGIKTLDLPNYSLSLLYVLLNVPLHGAQSRARNHVGQIIKARINELEDERIKTLERYAKKDAKSGEPLKKTSDQGEEYDLTPESLLEYRKEFDIYMKEKSIIDLLPSVKADLALIRPLILDSRVPLETPDGYVYDELCKLFEAI